jgi:hypothetical protein
MPVLGFFVFHWWLSNQKSDPYALIPGNAFAVLYSEDLYSNWDSLESSNLWKNLQGLPNLATKDRRMQSLYSMFGGKKKVEAFFKNKKVVVSLHLTDAHEFDYLFFIPVSSGTDDETLNNLIEKVKSDTSFQIEERKYEDLEIKEVIQKANQSSFSFLRYKDLLICSYSAIIMDDVIRVINQEAKDNFLKNNQKVKTPPHAGSRNFIYINYKNLSGLTSVFSDSTDFFKPLNNFADYSSFDFKMGKKDLLFTGLTAAGQNDFLNVFKGQKPQQFTLKNYVPNNTSSFYYFGFDNGLTLNESLVNYWKKADSSVIEARRDVYELYNIDFSTIFSELGNEIGLSILEPDKPGRASGRLLFLKAGNSNRFFLHLNKIVTLAKEDRNDTLYHEQYREYIIREMNIPDFPQMMLGQFFNGFQKSYYVVIGDCIVFSDDPRHLRQLTDNIEAENVWSKTASINSMLERSFSASNVSYYIDTEKSWKNLFLLSSPDVKVEMQTNAEELKQIHQTLIQYKVVNGKIFSSVLINHHLDQEILNIDNSYVSENTVSMERGILSEPFLFSDKAETEIIVQDSAFQVYSVSNGLIVWNDTLGKAISGPVVSKEQKKGEVTYYGVAQNILFAYGKNGARPEGFPVTFSDSVLLNTIAVIDYDHSGEHKIMVTDQKGHLYIVDTQGKPVEGWKSTGFKGRLKHPVKHARIKGKDILIALQEDGRIWALNSKGELYKGFPLDLKTPSSNPVFLDTEESSAENSILTILSDRGELIKMDLKGAILKRENVSNLSAGSAFKLCLNQTENSYVIITQSKNELSVLNDKSEEVFDMILNSVNLDLGYYTNSDKALFVIFDRDASLCYLMDDKGKNILKSAVKATKPLKINFKGNEVDVVKVNQYQLEEGLIK